MLLVECSPLSGPNSAFFGSFSVAPGSSEQTETAASFMSFLPRCLPNLGPSLLAVVLAGVLAPIASTELHAAPYRGAHLLAGVPIALDCEAELPPAHPVFGMHPGSDIDVYRAGRDPQLTDAAWLSAQLCRQVWGVLAEAGAHGAPTDLNLPSMAVLQARMVDVYLDSSRVVDQRIDNSLWPVSVPHWSLEMTWQMRFQVQYGSGVLGPSLDLVMRGSSQLGDYQQLDLEFLLESAASETLARIPTVLSDEGRLGELLFTLRADDPKPPASWATDPGLREFFGLLLSIEDEVRHGSLAIFLSSPKLPLETRRDLARWFAINEPSFPIQRDALAWYMQQEALPQSGDPLQPEALELLRWLLQRAHSHRLRVAALLSLKDRKQSVVRELLLAGATDADPRVADVALSQLHNFKAATASELQNRSPATPPHLPRWTLELDGRIARTEESQGRVPLSETAQGQNTPRKGSQSKQLLTLSTRAGGEAAALWLRRWLSADQITADERPWILAAWRDLCGAGELSVRLAVMDRLVRERQFVGVDELITERSEAELDPSLRALALAHLADGPRQLSVILAAASGPEPLVRTAAAEALATQSHPSAEIRLRELVRSDADRKVKAAARKALRAKNRARQKRR